VSLDFHEGRQFFPLTMDLQIHGDVTEGQVLDALRLRRASPRAFGLPVGMFTRGPLGVLTRLAESARRPMAAALRPLRRRGRRLIR
jgi:hypothetical protein